jgi:hypothetical protein
MLRSIITLALSVFLLAEASAQTTPAVAAKKEAKAAKKQTKASARAAKKAAKETARLARQTKATTVPQVAVTDDGWPPLESTTIVASAAPEDDPRNTYGVTPVHNRAEDVVYAAPGMAVHVNSKEPVPYSVRPARKPAAETTLGR